MCTNFSGGGHDIKILNEHMDFNVNTNKTVAIACIITRKSKHAE